MLRNVIRWQSFKGTFIYKTKAFFNHSIAKSKHATTLVPLKLNSTQKKLVEYYIQNELPDKELEKQVKDLKTKIIEKVTKSKCFVD
jgi:hypothetical protein